MLYVRNYEVIVIMRIQNMWIDRFSIVRPKCGTCILLDTQKQWFSEDCTLTAVMLFACCLSSKDSRIRVILHMQKYSRNRFVHSYMKICICQGRVTFNARHFHARSLQNLALAPTSPDLAPTLTQIISSSQPSWFKMILRIDLWSNLGRFWISEDVLQI